VGEHFPGMLDEHTEQIIFFRRKLNLLIADFDDPTHEVHRQVAATKHRAFSTHLQLMSQRCPNSGEQFLGSERLRHVIVGTKIKRLHLAGLVATTRQHNNRHAFVAAADYAQQFMTLDVR